MSEPTPCKMCGRQIVFAQGPNGAIPMDAKAVTVYRIVTDDAGSTQRGGTAVKVEHEFPVYISHFVSCPGIAAGDRPSSGQRRTRRS